MHFRELVPPNSAPAEGYCVTNARRTDRDHPGQAPGTGRRNRRPGDAVLAEPADDRRHVGCPGPLLRGRYRVILVDPPGHGGSERLSATFTFDECARSIADVLDALGVTRAHIVGNSWGGMIGATFAAAYPDRVGAAVLMNCTASAAGGRQRLEYAALLRIARLLGRIRPPLTRSVLKAFLGPTTFTTRPEVVEFVRAAVHSVDIGSAAWAVRSVVPLRPDQRPALSRSPHPFWWSPVPRTPPSRSPRPRHGPVHPRRVDRRTGRSGAPRGPGEPRAGEQLDRRVPR